MPRIRLLARAVGIAFLLTTAAGDARAQAPRAKPAPPAQDQEGDDEAMPARPARPAKPGARADAKAAPGNGRPAADKAEPAAGLANGNGNGLGDPAGNPGRGNGRGGGRNGSSLDRLRETLTNPANSVAAALLPLPPIQQELNLTEKQKAAVQKVVQGMGQQNRALGQQRRELMMAARMSGMMMMPDTGEMQVQEAAFQQQNGAALAAILTKPEQRRRLNQIATQILGPLAVAKPDVAEKLNLAPGQVDDIAAIMMERQAGLEQLRGERRMAGFLGRDPNADPASRDLNASKTLTLDQKAKKLQVDISKKIGRILNKKQKADYVKLLGEPFDLDLLDDPRPGPRGPGGSGPGDAPPPGGNGAMPRDRTAAKAAPKDAEADADAGEAPPPKSDRPRGPARRGAGAKAARPAADPEN